MLVIPVFRALIEFGFILNGSSGNILPTGLLRISDKAERIH